MGDIIEEVAGMDMSASIPELEPAQRPTTGSSISLGAPTGGACSATPPRNPQQFSTSQQLASSSMVVSATSVKGSQNLADQPGCLPNFSQENRDCAPRFEPAFESILRKCNVVEEVIMAYRLNEILHREMFRELDQRRQRSDAQWSISEWTRTKTSPTRRKSRNCVKRGNQRRFKWRSNRRSTRSRRPTVNLFLRSPKTGTAWFGLSKTSTAQTSTRVVCQPRRSTTGSRSASATGA